MSANATIWVKCLCNGLVIATCAKVDLAAGQLGKNALAMALLLQHPYFCGFTIG